MCTRAIDQESKYFRKMANVEASPRRQRTTSNILSEYENILWKLESQNSTSPDDSGDTVCGSAEASLSGESLDSNGPAPAQQFTLNEELTTNVMESMLSELFDCVENSSKIKNSNESILPRLMKLIGVLMLRVPKPYFLNRLFRLCYINSQMMFLVARCFRSMFEESHFEPGETLMFPQVRFTNEEFQCTSQTSISNLEKRAAGFFVLDKELKTLLSNGLTVSTWLNLMSNQFEEKQHIISVGSEDFRISAEICPRSLALRVTIVLNDVLIYKKVFAKLLKPNSQWVNLVLGIKYEMEEIEAFIMAGNHVHNFVKSQRMKVDTNTKIRVAVGACVKTNASDVCIYRLSTIFGFRGLLSPEYGVMLRSLGSACFSLTECRLSQKYSSLFHCLGKPIISSRLFDAAHVCNNWAFFLNKLQRRLFFTWRPSSAACYSLNALQTGADYTSFMDCNESALCLTMSMELHVEWFGTILQEKRDTIDKSLRTIGSVKLFLFLYTLSVETNSSIEVQAEAFHLLFVCLKRDPSYFEIFNEIGGPLVLVRILSSRTAKINAEMCQDILMFSFTKLESRNDGELHVSPRTAIIAPDFLKTIICAADIWKGKRFQHWVRIVFVISESVSDSVPDTFRSFNRRRLNQVQFLHQLLLALLDMDMDQTRNIFLSSMTQSVSSRVESRQSFLGTNTTPGCVASVIKNLVAELIGSPLQPTEVTQLWDFLLLSHPAQDTYFDYFTRSHNDWICEELIGFSDELEVGGPFELSKFFEDILKEYGTNYIKKLWHDSGHNIIKMRCSLFKTSTTPTDDFTGAEDSFRTCRMNSISNPPNRPVQLDASAADAAMSESLSGDGEHWLVETRAELLSLMSNVVLNCDDELMAVLEKDVLYWQTILVLLSNQKHDKIRTYTFVLIKNFFLRCSLKYRQMFVNKQGFIILSNELKKSRVNSAMADALFSMTIGEHISIRDGLDEEHLMQIKYDSFKIASFHALYALLEESTSDSALFWSVCSTLQKIFVSDHAPRREMFENGLISVLSNSLWKLCFSKNSPPVDSPMFSLIDCWTTFAQSVIAYTIPYRNTDNYTACEDFAWLCIIACYQTDTYLNQWNTHLDISNISKIEHGFDLAVNKDFRALDRQFLERGIRTFRKALCKIIYCWIDTIQTILTDQFASKKGGGRASFGGLGSSMDESDFEVVDEYGQEHYWSSPSAKSKKEFALANDMASRLLFGLTIAQNLFFHISSPSQCSDQEETLFRYYIDIILSTWKRKQDEKLNDEWQSVLLLCREKARGILAELIAYVLYPASVKLAEIMSNEHQGRNKVEPFNDSLKNGTLSSDIPWTLKRRLIIARNLARETIQDRYYMEALLDVNLKAHLSINCSLQDYQYAMKIALHELALLPSIVLKYNINEYNAEIESLVKFLSRIQIESPLSKLTKEEISSVISDEALLIHSYIESRKNFCNEIATKAFMISETDNALNKITTDTAMTLTCEIAEFQNNPRRTFIFWRKDLMNDLAHAGNMLENFSRELCHPEAAFFDSSIWPIGRTLETTENFCRERRRLTPCHYQFPLKFLQKSQRALVEKLDASRTPFHNILHSFKEHKSLNHTEAITQVRLGISATLLRADFECHGEIVVSDTKLYFLGEQAQSVQKHISCRPVTYSFEYDKIWEIQVRSYQLDDRALEIFTTSGDAFFIIFASGSERDSLKSQLEQMNLGHLFVDYKSQLTAATEKWRKSAITNFEYLMILNKLAGRTYNDMMQYPVFPFILSNYSQNCLDLNSPSSFRDLAKPMAIQDPKMESVYLQIYKNLQEECDKSDSDMQFSSARFGAYHYGSHYSNTGVIAHYLVRVSPYTRVALEYQDNNFDIADRLFNSLETAWRLSSSESTTDFKELIPEFFFFPEMFQNRERLALGVCQSGQVVEDVELPPWCPRADGGRSIHGDPRLFCLIHRQALESAVVTANLHSWIDLIFGIKQDGEHAIKAINTFHPATYRNRRLQEMHKDDGVSVSAIHTMVRTYGQMPLMLLMAPHLPPLSTRKSSSTSNLASLPILSSTMSLNTLENDNLRRLNRVFRTVEGLRWGEYYGSPEIDCKYYRAPNYVFEVDANERINNLRLVFEKDGSQSCYGVPSDTELLTFYRWDRRDGLRRNFEPILNAALSWRFTDNVLRIKRLQKNEDYWINLIDMQSLELVSVAFSSNNEFLFLGFKCGLIRVYSLSYRNENVSFHRKWTIKLRSELFAHEYPIASMCACDEFHILVSTSTDKKICVWDMNRLEFISVLHPPSSAEAVDEVITLCCVSLISGDICVCLQSGRGSRIVLFTINGDVIGVHNETETVISMTMTNIPEGLGINCVALGLSNGVIRLLDMWTMNFMRDFSYGRFTQPIISLLYANESRRLYAVSSGLKVLCLQLPSLSSGPFKMPIFKALSPFS